ncbi:hypothetical protein QBC47DRAFT_359079 [Echria macrotheca]|uniref:Uncharacterized protein n=1 Tax=Echria macrotheca TaxID=438768 RepID=A0AAJ0BIM9_9PEZI|nr:hypothetical protein QBC47DRAFT_359079 [Echria macrotheca]
MNETTQKTLRNGGGNMMENEISFNSPSPGHDRLTLPHRPGSSGAVSEPNTTTITTATTNSPAQLENPQSPLFESAPSSYSPPPSTITTLTVKTGAPPPSIFSRPAAADDDDETNEQRADGGTQLTVITPTHTPTPPTTEGFQPPQQRQDDNDPLSALTSGAGMGGMGMGMATMPRPSTLEFELDSDSDDDGLNYTLENSMSIIANAPPDHLAASLSLSQPEQRSDRAEDSAADETAGAEAEAGSFDELLALIRRRREAIYAERFARAGLDPALAAAL